MFHVFQNEFSLQNVFKIKVKMNVTGNCHNYSSFKNPNDKIRIINVQTKCTYFFTFNTYFHLNRKLFQTQLMIYLLNIP